MKSPVCQNKRVPRKELFHPDKIRQKSLDSHFVYIGKETIHVFLILSAIRHSCNFFGDLGINQRPLTEYKEYKDHICHGIKFDQVFQWLAEPSLLYTLGFIHHMSTVEKSFLPLLMSQADKARLHKSLVGHSLSQYMPEDVNAEDVNSCFHVGHCTV